MVFVTLLVIMDPRHDPDVPGTHLRALACAPGAAWPGRRWPSRSASSPPFALFGQQILRHLGTPSPALQGAGDCCSSVALELLDRQAGPSPEDAPDVNVALVPLGTPLLAGPGAIVATIVFVRRATGSAVTAAIAAGIVAVLVVLYLALSFAA